MINFRVEFFFGYLSAALRGQFFLCFSHPVARAFLANTLETTLVAAILTFILAITDAARNTECWEVGASSLIGRERNDVRPRFAGPSRF